MRICVMPHIEIEVGDWISWVGVCAESHVRHILDWFELYK